MREALKEARKGLGRTSPNPVVGAVVVRDNQVIARGYHRRAGLAHAEVEVLNSLMEASERDVLYVTLEPCNHQGRTQPCTRAILKKGIRHVVVGMSDPNPGVAGGGCRFLKHHGVRVTTGILASDCRRLNEVFVKYVTTGRPFVMAKTAMTLDGWTATAQGDSKWVTNEASRGFVHRLRDRVDAVMVGVGTVLADNPSLTARLKRGRGKDPLRIVLDTHMKTPPNATIVTEASAARTLVVTAGDSHEPRPPLEAEAYAKATVLYCPLKQGKIDLHALLKKLGEMSVTSLLVEGGAAVMGSLIREKLIDKFYIFKAPKILGGRDGIPMAAGKGPKKMKESLMLTDIKTRRFNEDILITGYPVQEVHNSIVMHPGIE